MNRQKALMKKYLSRPENRYCADCKRPSPTWASLNLGVFVCIKCSGCHREIGVHITKIKSVELDLWPSKALNDFAKINNDIANAYWEYDLKNYDYQRIRENEIRLIEFIRDKYEFRRWVKPRVPDPMSLVIQGRDLVKEFMNNGEAVKMYEKSEEPELEKRSQHFGRQKNEKKGKSFGIVDKGENNNNLNKNTNNNEMNNDINNNINNNQNSNNNKNKSEKGFGFIKHKQNNNNVQNNNKENNSNSNTNNNFDLLGFGNEQSENNTNNPNQINSDSNNSFPFDIFNIGFNQTNNNDFNINNNINSNISNNTSNNHNLNNNLNNNLNISSINENNIQSNISLNNGQPNTDKKNVDSNTKSGFSFIKDSNKSKSGFSFIKKKNMDNNQNNPKNSNDNNTLNSQNQNSSNEIDNIFNNSQKPAQNNNNNNINNNNISVNEDKNITNLNQNINKSNNLINIFGDDQLVDIFNIETPTSDAVLNLSKNLLNIYSEKDEDKNKSILNNPNTSNYNVLNMNYPNININNYYPNEQQTKSKIGMITNNFGMNPMMGYNYQPQQNYMNNNFGVWYGYGMNNMGGQYMGMNINSRTMNPGFNYTAEFYRDPKNEKEEPKPILLNNNTFELNLGKNKEKEDPFKNLVDFK